MREILTLEEFASDTIIKKLLSKERAKFTVKNNGRSERHDSIYREQLKPMMPPRKDWVNPSKGLRPRKAKNGLGRWTYGRKMADARIWGTIIKTAQNNPEELWLQRMNEFVGRIQRILAGEEAFTMESPKVQAKFKKKDRKSGEYIYRPLCAYSSLETKVILALTYKYLLYVLDESFHRNMLFMRASRETDNGDRQTPNFKDAIRMVESYRRKHNWEDIYVGECDIQKFYDILNHEVILDCFNRMFSLISEKYDIDKTVFNSVIRIIKQYLDSFDYYSCVMKLNEDQSLPLWRREKGIHRSSKNPDPICKFKWVDDKDFIASGCYDRESLEKAKNGGLLGIPQGGALSGIIVNVVMQCIDYDIVKDPDPGRLFIRYCDDILLLHTDKEKCKYYLDLYHKNLRECKLVAHQSKDVKSFKNGVRTHKEFWDAKSKNVYRWGEGEGDASDWIAFVGYEMRRTGEVRIRKDKIDEIFTRIAHKYFQVIKANNKRTAEEKLSKFNRLAPKILDYEMQTRGDRYAKAQARHLDKYLVKKVWQAAKHLKTDFPKDLVRYVDIIDEL